eukprot:CAMPEP_0201591890 /NCGR_PEP_ID=MMETSP0190_2-20130828/189930_1 /ASSEMBLY_ACC=CAM_ASM_000263 /TAXON_ID=37353 /ORGANISM="Rosalina sp." /LENGTH=261 /DNA_ID=CAMNT_0048050399 /DNA_START=158 /DNA_END=943 /DNA_ORIENTATION=-
MATRAQFGNSSEIGVFAKLTNAYCLVGQGGSQNFYSTFASELDGKIPVIQCSIQDVRIIGRLCVGNKKGLLVPDTTTDQELQHLRNSLPDSVKIQRIEEKLSALGNCIITNDHVALIHPDIDKSTEEIVADVFDVEVFRQSIAGQSLVGSYAAVSNNGALVHPKCTKDEQKELSSLLQVPVMTGTVNRGSSVIGSAMVVNDWCSFVGSDTTATEIGVIENIFNLNPDNNDEVDNDKNKQINKMKQQIKKAALQKAMIDDLI